MHEFLDVLSNASRPAVFTAGDLIEGLGFMEPIHRRAVLFGLEQSLTCEQTIDLTHKQLPTLALSELAQMVVQACPRHIRLPYVFWEELPSGIAAPLIELEESVRFSFGGMGWNDLRFAYHRMVWVDLDAEADCFLEVAREHWL